MAYIRARSRSKGILNQISSHIIQEGRSNSIERNPLDTEFTKMKEASAEVTMAFADFEFADLDYILSKANDISDQFENHFSTHLFETLDDVTKKTGLRYDGAGRPITNEAIIEALSAIQMDFDEFGNPNISIVTSPAMAASFQKLQAEFDSNPALQKRWNEMIEKKRDEFRTREINRDLAG